MNGLLDHALFDASDIQTDTQIRNNNIDRVVYALIAQVETFVAVGAITPSESRLAIDRLWNRWNGTPRATPATSPIVHENLGRGSYGMHLSQLVGRRGVVPSVSEERATTGYSTRPPHPRAGHLLDHDGTEDYISSHNPKHSLAGQFSVTSLNPEYKHGSQHNVGGRNGSQLIAHHAANGEDLIQLFDDEPSGRAVPRSQANPIKVDQHVPEPTAEPAVAQQSHGHQQLNEQEPWSTDHWGPRRYDLPEPPPPEFRVPMTAEARRNQEWRKMRLIPPGRLDAWELANLTPESAAIYKAYNEGKLPEGTASFPPREDRPLQDPYWDDKNEEHVLNITSRGDALTSPSTASQDSVSSKVIRRREKAKARAARVAELAAEERAAAAAEALNKARERGVRDREARDAAASRVDASDTAAPNRSQEPAPKDMADSEARLLGASAPETTAPATVGHEAPTPDSTVTGMAKAEVVGTESVAPPKNVVPESVASERTYPESVIPDSVASESTFPEAAISQSAVSERTISERVVPESTIPERGVPERVILDRNSFKRVPASMAAPETISAAGPSPSVPSGTTVSEAVPPTTHQRPTSNDTPTGAKSSALIVCPFWLTRPKLCSSKYCDNGFIHELVPGAVQQRLECWFWANKGDCNKKDACQLEHRQTLHGHVMREPHFYEKKRKKLRERDMEQAEEEMEMAASPGRPLHNAPNPWRAKSWRRDERGWGAGEERYEERGWGPGGQRAEERGWAPGEERSGDRPWGAAEGRAGARAEQNVEHRVEHRVESNKVEHKVEQNVEQDDDKPQLWDW